MGQGKKETPLRIIRLEAENVKRLKAVAITPKGDVIQITGANDNGKTSVLDSIWLVLDHKRVDAPVPVRKGEKKARIRLELGDGAKVELVVERKINADGVGGSLVVESEDGARLGSPQNVLNAMIGSLSFDPLAFTRLKQKDQFDELRRVANVGVDFDQLDAHNRGDFERRTEVNRQLKAKRAQAEAVVLPPKPTDPRVDEAEALDAMQRASEHNANVSRIKASVGNLSGKAASLRLAADAARQRAQALRAEAATLDENAAASEAQAAALDKNVAEARIPEEVDVAVARGRVENARRINEAHRAYEAQIERREALRAEADKLEVESDGYTHAIEAREKQKADAVQAAKMPVEGLGFGEGLVTYKGVPFQQASSAVQLRVSLAIAMASHPRLRLMFIRDGSLLDEHSMEIVAEMAAAGGYQVWVEKVDTSGKLGVFIEDGSVAAVDGVRTPKLI